MIIGWFSCGITSAVACKMALNKYGKDNVKLYYFVIDSAHSDNERFIKDCEKWYGVKIERRRSETYTDQFDVIKKTRYINGPAGARCTAELKKNVRFKVEAENKDFIGQVFGFEFSKKEINRAIRFSEQWPLTKPIFPLIDSKLNKNQCADILLKNGIKIPSMYELGYHNNNCIGCVKGGAGYWNKIRVDFPEHFKKMSGLERDINHTCLKDSESNSIFLDEMDADKGRHEDPILPDCGTFCEIEFADLIDEKTEEVYTGLKSMQQLSLF